jgi:hypothetical protein
MAKLLKLRRGTDTQHTTFTGAEGEVTVNTTNDSLHVHDGSTAGGTELAKADLSNVDSSLSNNLGFADGTKALFGTGNDLEIYHNGSDSVISDLGTGDLYIKSSSTFIRTGTNESMANFNADGSVQLYHNNAQKLATTSTGIDVTGTVTCDGLTCAGDAQIEASTGILTLKDTDNTGSANVNYVRGRDSDNSTRWYLGQSEGGSEEVRVYNNANSEIIFGTNGSSRAKIQSDGHFSPASDDTYDLGTSSLQWRNGYFAGGVTCDGLTCDGQILAQNTAEYQIVVKDTNSSGTAAETGIGFRDSGNTTQGQLGFISNGNNIFYIINELADEVRLGTSATGRCRVDANGHFTPIGNNLYDLGSNSQRWRDGYFAGDVTFANDQRFPSVPQSYQSSNITLVVTHAGTVVDTNSAVNVPANVFSTGHIVTIYNRSTSAVNVNQSSGLTMRLVGDGGTGNRTLDAYGMATIWFRSATDCIISGIGVN